MKGLRYAERISPSGLLPSRQTLSATLIVIASFLFALSGVWATLLLRHIDGFFATCLRSAIAGMLIYVYLRLRRRSVPFQLRANAKTYLILAFGTTMIGGPFFFATRHVGVGVTTTVVFISFFLGMFVMGKVLYGEPISRTHIVAGIVAVVGVLLLGLGGESPFSLLGIGAAVLSGFGSTLATSLPKRLPYPPSQQVLASLLMGVPSNALMALLLEQPRFGDVSLHVFGLLLVFSTTIVVASSMFFIGYRHLTSVFAGLLSLFELVFAVGLGIVLFHERLSLVTLLGCVIILLAAALPSVLPWWNSLAILPYCKTAAPSNPQGASGISSARRQPGCCEKNPVSGHYHNGIRYPRNACGPLCISLDDLVCGIRKL